MRARLQIKDMNGISVTEVLDDMALFTGPNGSGKSTRLKALTLALLGYLPDGPKRASDIMHYATGDTMHVAFEMPFLRIDRQYTGSTASARSKVDVGPDEGAFKNDEATDKEKQDRILAELGGVPFALDLGAFTGMNQNQQRAFILDICAKDDGSDPWEAIEKALREKKVDPAHPTILQAKEGMEPEASQTLAGMLAHLVISLRSQQSQLQQAMKNAEGTARDMAKERTNLNTSSTAIAETKEEIARIQAELEALSAEKGKLATAGGANEVIAAQLKALERDIAAKTRLTGPGYTPDQAREEIATADRAIKALEELQAKLEQENKDLEARREELDAKAAELGAEAATGAARIEAAQRRADLLQEGKCPVGLQCNHPPEAFHEALQQALKMVGYYGRKRQAGEEIHKALFQEIARLKTRAAEIQQERNGIPSKLLQARQSLGNAQARQQALVDLEDLRKRHQELTAQAEKTVVTSDEQALAAKEAGLRSRLEDLNKELEAKELQKANEIAFTRALEDRQRCEEDLEVVKKAVAALGPKGLQAEAAKTAAGPFLGAVNLTLQRFGLKAYVETERSGKPVFEFGLEHPTHGRRSWEVLPRSFRAILGVAIALAFFILRASRKAILIVDDLEHLDERTRARFFEVIAGKIKEGTLDLFVGAQTVPQKAGKILKVVELKAPAQRDPASAEKAA